MTSVRRAAETSSPGHPGHSRDRTPAAQTEAGGWGGAGSRRTPTWGEGARQAPGPLSCRAWEGHGTQAQPSLRLCAVPENLNPSGVGLGSAGNPGRVRQFPCRATWSLSTWEMHATPAGVRQFPCGATWSLSGIGLGNARNPGPCQTVPLRSKLEPERRRQTGVARTLCVLPTPASGICWQCFSLPASQLKE